MGGLLRLVVWAACAIIAVGVVRLAGRSEVGAARASAALAALRTSPIDLLDPGAAQARKAEAEVKDLADTVRTLTDDRDSLAARVATLERNLTDLAGSIARERAAAPSGSPPGDQASASSSPVPPTQGASASALPAAPLESAAANDDARPTEALVGTIVTVPPPRSGPLATIQSYVSAASTSQPATRLAEAPAGTAAADAAAPKGTALELAIATNVNALRARWGALKFQHPALLEGLKPRVAVRPSARPGFTEFHLVAGPVGSNDVAVRLCGALAAARVPCRPAPYDGQSLELR